MKVTGDGERVEGGGGVVGEGKGGKLSWIHHFHHAHNTPCLPAKILSIVFNYAWDAFRCYHAYTSVSLTTTDV